MASEDNEPRPRIRSSLTGRILQPQENLTLVMLREVRAELKLIRDTQARDRELIPRLASSVDRLSEQARRGFAEVQEDIREIRSDVVMIENRLLTASNEILDAQRRLTEALIDSTEPEPEPPEEG